MLVLNTCQRLETFGLAAPVATTADDVVEVEQARDAFRRLARIAAGLESRILGELEILGQVREACKSFSEVYGKDVPELDRLFQDALSLARRARRESGVDRNLTGLASLAARRIIETLPEEAPVAIIGSGSIAKSAARYLGKRSSLPIRVSSRCPENAMKLAMEVGGFARGLDDLAPLIDGVSAVLTATAAPHPLLYDHHLKPSTGAPTLIIDLGEPPDCSPELQVRKDVQYIGLLEVESWAKDNEAERARRAVVAEQIIDTVSRSYPVPQWPAIGA